MEIKEIDYPTSLDNNIDIDNDNIDIFVDLDDGMTYTMTVCTPSFYYWYMDNIETDYVPAAPPNIIVRKLTEKNIKDAITSFVGRVEQAYWLKVYYLVGDLEDAFDLELLDKMIYEMKKKTESNNNDDVGVETQCFDNPISIVP